MVQYITGIEKQKSESYLQKSTSYETNRYCYHPRIVCTSEK